ncbi:MAG TPA: energy transducer TonB [Blastocatellia bacterium]|jgi:protein TonB|nr:energy transducer TonB [Blastocatellia bacterium]
MFDTLVESSKHGQDNSRTGKYMLVTGGIYAVTLLVIAVTTVIYMSPELADRFDVSAMIAPPPPPSAPPPPAQQVVVKNIPAPTTFTPPTKPPERIPDPTTVAPKQVVAVSHGVPGGVPGGMPGGVPGGTSRGDDVPPPPPPKPPEPTPTPAPPKKLTVSGGVLQGKAISRVQPPYPPIARAARASGAVQVQVTISEDGRVIEAAVIAGHPLLRDAALQAAKQWKFQPTELSGVPVKVQGILTFNFTLQ